METIGMSTLLLLMACVIIIQSTSDSNEQFTKRKTFLRENSLPGSFGALFRNLSSEHTAQAAQDHINVSLPVSKDVQPDFTIDSAEPMLSNMSCCKDVGSFTNHSKFISVPVSHSFEKYKIIVVTAPPHIKLTAGDAEPLVIYIVFDEDPATDDFKIPNMPDVYFVTQRNGRINLSTKEQSDPIWVINHNRTVTGLKSKGLAKFVKFKKKRPQSEAWTITP